MLRPKQEISIQFECLLRFHLNLMKSTQQLGLEGNQQSIIGVVVLSNIHVILSNCGVNSTSIGLSESKAEIAVYLTNRLNEIIQEIHRETFGYPITLNLGKEELIIRKEINSLTDEVYEQLQDLEKYNQS